MLTFGSIMMGSMQPKVLADFYEKVLEQKPVWQDGSWSAFEIGNTSFTIGEHSETQGKSKDPVRIILNFETNHVKKEFERVKNIEGIEIIKEPYEMEGAWIATLADPDGNYFQLLPPWEDK